jgi:hypothetical protein
VFGNRVLRRMFGPKRVEVRGRWMKMHNEEIHNSYSSPSIIKMINGEGGKAYRISVGKLEGKKPLGRPRHGWMKIMNRNNKLSLTTASKRALLPRIIHYMFRL